MIHNDREIYIKNIFSSIAPYIDFLNRVFSFGIDMRWRKRLVAFGDIQSSGRVLDICTGTGDLAFLLSKKVGPDGSVIGVDFCEEMLEIANKRKKNSYNNTSFVLSNAKELKFPDNFFDAVTVAFGIRNIPETETALNEVRRVLRPRGKFLCLELTRPSNRLFLPVYKLYTFRVMPVVARIVSKTKTPYKYLPQSIEAFYRPGEFKEMMQACGLSDVTIRPMTGGIATLYRAVKK